MKKELAEHITEAMKKYEKSKIFKREGRERKIVLDDYVSCELKLTKMLNKDQTDVLNDYRRAVFDYIESVKSEYFSAGFLYAVCNESHINKKGQNN